MFEYSVTVVAVFLYGMDTTETAGRTESQSETRVPRTAVRNVIAGVLLVEAVSILIGAIVHLGVRIPIGIMVLTEPQIIPATIVEGICGLVLLGAVYAVLTRKPWSWRAVVVAQMIALGGVVLGIVALAFGAGPNTASNALYHRTMVVLLVGGLLLSPTRIVKTALNQN